MPIICDTHVLIFWQDDPSRLTSRAREAMAAGLWNRELACADITFWEIAMLMRIGRLRNDIIACRYMDDLRLALALTVLPITPEIAAISQDDRFNHKDPADRLIAASAICHRAPLISADRNLQGIDGLTVIW